MGSNNPGHGAVVECLKNHLEGLEREPECHKVCTFATIIGMIVILLCWSHDSNLVVFVP